MSLRALLLLALASTASASDWPQWRGPARDGVSPAAQTRWPAALAPAWSMPVGTGHASPVASGGRVFVFTRQGEDEVLQALELATGKRVWRQAYHAPYTMHPAATGHGKGPKATPTVAGGRVFTLGVSGTLSAHDAATGRLLWRKAAGDAPAGSPEFGAAQSPLVDGSRLIVHVGSAGGSALTAYDVATGKVAWTWTGDGPAYASPVVTEVGGTRQVVTFTQSRLVGVEAATGALLWSTPFTTDYEQNAVTPVVKGDLVIYSGLDRPLKAERIVEKGTTWATEPVWENAEFPTYMSTPVLAGGRLFGFSHRKRGQLFAVDAATGKTAWAAEGRGGENAALVAAGNAILALTTGGELLVLDARASTFTVLQRYPVARTPTWAHLAVVADGVLVKDLETLAYLRF